MKILRLIKFLLYQYIPNLFQKYLGGHIDIGRKITIYGFNAMHVALDIYHKRYGHICFHPQLPQAFFGIGKKWSWYFYISPNATPWASTFAIGPGNYKHDKKSAKLRKKLFGYIYNTDLLFCPQCHNGHMDLREYETSEYENGLIALSYCHQCDKEFKIVSL